MKLFPEAPVHFSYCLTGRDRTHAHSRISLWPEGWNDFDCLQLIIWTWNDVGDHRTRSSIPELASCPLLIFTVSSVGPFQSLPHTAAASKGPYKPQSTSTIPLKTVMSSARPPGSNCTPWRLDQLSTVVQQATPNPVT